MNKPQQTWAEIEAPLIAQGERDAELLRKRLDEDAAGAREACDNDSGNWFMGRKWNVYRAENDSPHEDHETNTLVVEGVIKAQSEHIARHDPARVLRQCDSIRDALTDLERIHERGDPDSRAWARSAILSLRRIWEPDETEEAQ